MLKLGLVLMVAVGAGAQTSEADLRAKLLDKPLILRGGYEDDRLRFDAAGQVRDRVHVGSFTAAGVDLDGLQLKGNKLLLTGRRMGLMFRGSTDERVPMQVGRPDDRKDEGISIEIAAPANKDYSAVLGQIFAFDLKDMVPSMPAEWQVWAHHELLGEGPRQRNLRLAPGTRHVGGGVTAPIVQSQPEPEFSENARKMKISGNVLVYLIVGEDGRPQDVRIVQPMGMGLDEKAVQAVSGYKFKPAMENGEPVRVEMQVEVNFQIY